MISLLQVQSVFLVLQSSIQLVSRADGETMYSHPTQHLTLFFYHCSVTLTSSADSVCPGDTMVFTCVTDTGVLLWKSNGHNHVYLGTSGPQTTYVDIFTLYRESVTGKTLVSTATAHSVQLNHNGRVISCSDSISPDSSEINGTIRISSRSSLNLKHFIIFCLMFMMFRPTILTF